MVIEPSQLFHPSSRSRLTVHDLGRFPGDSLFDRLARAVCRAGCLPRKELFEAWETARRLRRLFRGGRVVDLGGGHGLVAGVMLLLDDSSPEAIVVDTVPPASGHKLLDVLAAAWPRLEGRVTFVNGNMRDVPLTSSDVVVSVHACGALTDLVLQRALSAQARVGVLPCCHDIGVNELAGLGGWLDGALAIDVARALRLHHGGYRVWTQAIPVAITPKNRLLMGAPAVVSAP